MIAMSRPLFLEVCLVTAMAVVILALGAPSVHASESDPEIHVDEIYFLDSGGNRTDYVLVGQNFTIRTHVWIEDTTTPHLMDVDVQFRENGELIGTYSMGWVQDGHDEWIEMNRTGREPAGQEHLIQVDAQSDQTREDDNDNSTYLMVLRP
ncbi:MAG TPA: hypothetical protein EYP43_02135, partial [Thermoplasmata archaeon]|nr:hypothetical protein [Thermoplasmata archaeon]